MPCCLPIPAQPAPIRRLTVRISWQAGVDQCNEVRAFSAGLASAIISSLTTVTCRLAFKRANKHGELGRVTSANKRQRTLALHQSLHQALRDRTRRHKKRQADAGAFIRPGAPASGIGEAKSSPARTSHMSAVRSHVPNSACARASRRMHGDPARSLLSSTSARFGHVVSSIRGGGSAKLPGGGLPSPPPSPPGFPKPSLRSRSPRSPLNSGTSCKMGSSTPPSPAGSTGSMRTLHSAELGQVSVDVPQNGASARAPAVMIGPLVPRPSCCFTVGSTGRAGRLKAWLHAPRARMRPSLGAGLCAPTDCARPSHYSPSSSQGLARALAGLRAIRSSRESARASGASTSPHGDKKVNDKKVNGAASAGVAAHLYARSGRRAPPDLSSPGSLSSGRPAPSRPRRDQESERPLQRCNLDDLTSHAGGVAAAGVGAAPQQKRRAGVNERDRRACVELDVSQLCVAHGIWVGGADGLPCTTPPAAAVASRASTGSCEADASVEKAQLEKKHGKLHAPRLGFCLPNGEKGGGLHFVPALTAGMQPGFCGALVRVHFALCMLPQGWVAQPTTGEVPPRPAVGTPLLTAAAESGGATAGSGWPPLMPFARQRSLIVAWMLSGACLLGGLLLLLDLSCVAPVVEVRRPSVPPHMRAPYHHTRVSLSAGGRRRLELIYLPCLRLVSRILPCGRRHSKGLGVHFPIGRALARCVHLANSSTIHAESLIFLVLFPSITGFLSPRARVLRAALRFVSNALQGLS